MKLSLNRFPHRIPMVVRAASLLTLVASIFAEPARAATCNTPNCTLDLNSSIWINNNTWGSSNSPAGWAESVSTLSSTAWRTDFNWPLAGNLTQDNSVKAYPSAVYGWHWGWHFPQTVTHLPQQLGASYLATSSYNYTVAFGTGGTGDVAYDIWVTNTSAPTWSTTPTDEIMIWVNATGGAAPCGGPTVSNINLEGGTWTLSECQIPNNQYVWSFVRTTNSSSGTLNIKNFLDWLHGNRGLSSAKYLAGIEFGSEIFHGTGNLNVTNYTCQVSPITSGIVANGTYKIIALHSGKALDVYGKGTADGTNVEQWSYNGGANQNWTLTHLGNNVYEIVGLQSGKALEVVSTSTSNGTNVDIRTYTGAANQKWTISAAPTSGYYRLAPVSSSGSALDVSGISTLDGANVYQWSWMYGKNQQWIFKAP